MAVSSENIYGRTIHLVLQKKEIDAALRARGRINISIEPETDASEWPYFEHKEVKLEAKKGNSDTRDSVCALIAEDISPKKVRWIGYTNYCALEGFFFSWLPLMGVRPLSEPHTLSWRACERANRLLNARKNLKAALINTPLFVFLELDNPWLWLQEVNARCDQHPEAYAETQAAEASQVGADISTEFQTTVKAIVDTRRGQGIFRQRLKSYWDSACAVTGCSVDEVLVASHMVPWEESTDTERLNPFNGLLLLASFDRLFDQHLITFTDEGKIRISPKLPQPEWKKLGLSAAIRLRKVDPRHIPFLARHRKRFEAKQYV